MILSLFHLLISLALSAALTTGANADPLGAYGGQNIDQFLENIDTFSRPPFFVPDGTILAGIEQALLNITKANQDGTARTVVSAQPVQVASTFSPMNPPSIPIAVKSPYLNAWAPSGSLLSVTPPNSQGNGGYLAGQDLSFWTSTYGANGDGRMTWTGLFRVDGEVYQFMGDACGTTLKACKNAVQKSMTYTSTRTIFTFSAGPILFTVTFLTPITPDDLVRQSLPMSYMHIEVDRKTVGNHKVQAYTDIDERWVTAHDYDYDRYPYDVTWSANVSGTSLYEVYRKSPEPFTEYRQRAEWGEVVFAARNQSNLSGRNHNNVLVQKQFSDDGVLDDTHIGVGGPNNAFGFAVDFSDQEAGDDAVFAIGHFRKPQLRYVKSKGSQPHQNRFGYWQSLYQSEKAAASFFVVDFAKALAAAKLLDQRVAEESKSAVGGGEIGDKYAAITQLSIRQALATLEVTVSFDNATKQYNTSDTLIFLKEISSGGFTSTVDVVFPLFPLLAYLSPELLRLTLQPLLDYQENGLFPHAYSAHDLGFYPDALGNEYGVPMPVEESGNMILMAACYAQLVADPAKRRTFLSKHYKILQQWARFLMTDSLVPTKQLSTDDFAGKLANQTNLALKGIEGIAAMSYVASVLGRADDAKMYRKTAKSFIASWQTYAISSDRSHVKLAYQDDRSWGILYNLFADRLLNLQLVPKSVYDIQDKWYPQVAQEWGVPLDTRHNWTKTDWQMFASATSASTSTRDLFINLLHKFVSNGQVDAPFTDLYETTSGDLPKEPFDYPVRFLARPVVGGHFAHLALAAVNNANGISDSTPYAYGAETNSTAPEAASSLDMAQARDWNIISRSSVTDPDDDQSVGVFTADLTMDSDDGHRNMIAGDDDDDDYDEPVEVSVMSAIQNAKMMHARRKATP